MMERRQMWVSKEFDDLINKQIDGLIEDCKLLGIPQKNIRAISKTKATRIIAKRIIENEKVLNIGLLPVKAK